LTPLFVRVGVSASAVTFLGLLVSLVMPFVAERGGQHAYVAVAAMALGNHVLDCLDGNIARTTGRSSGTGALLDGFCDLLFWTLYFASIGLLVRGSSDSLVGRHGLELGLGLAILVLL